MSNLLNLESTMYNCTPKHEGEITGDSSACSPANANNVFAKLFKIN